MGGGQKVKQTNPAQAAAANAGATSAANNATNLSNTFAGQQQSLFNSLYGPSGAVSKFLDPNSLNVTKPTGVFALQNTNANTSAAKQYAMNEGNIKAGAEQSGFGPNTPAGFVQGELNSNRRALADTKGTNFTTATSNQYQDALKNFWNAANLTQGGSEAAGTGALQGNSTAANTYANLYGTAGHGNVVQSANYLSPILGAAGTLGAAAMGPGGIATNAAANCCAAGTIVRTNEGASLPIEKCFEGVELVGLPEWDDNPIRVIEPLQFAMRPCVRIKTDGGQELVCSIEHTLVLAGGGYVTAKEALGKSVRTRDGAVEVVEVEPAVEQRVVRLKTDAPHVYETNGLLSEE